MELVDYLNENLVLTNLSVDRAQEAIRVTAQRLYHVGYVKESYADAVLDREKTFPTGIENEGYNFAIPHTDCSHVNRPAIAIATFSKPVKFARMDLENESTEVRVLFMLAITEPEMQLGALRSLMQLLQDHALYDDLCKCKTPQSLLEMIHKKIE